MKAHTNYTTVIATTPWMQRIIMVFAILIVGSIALAYIMPQHGQSFQPAIVPADSVRVPAASNWRFHDEALAGVQGQQAIGAYTLPERLSDVRQAAPAQAARVTTVQRYGAFNRVFADEQLAAQAYAAPQAVPASVLLETPLDARDAGPR